MEVNSLTSVNGGNEVNELLQLNVAKSMLKETLGDGMEFEIVYETLLNSAKSSAKDPNTKNIISELSRDNIENAIYKNSEIVNAGSNLKSIPMRVNQSQLISMLNNLQTRAAVTTSDTSDSMKSIYNSVNKYSSEYGVDPNLILAIIKQESDFNPSATSPCGAMGLMQLMPSCCQDNGVTSPYDIDDNIKGGVKNIKKLLNYYNGDLQMALMGYNAGIGTVSSRGVSSALELYKMPKETQGYVPKVLAYYNEFSNK